MLPATLIKGYDRRRLRNLLGGLFVALAIPTTAVLWQAYDQLKWEAWYQYRNQAEAFTDSVDLALAQRVASTERRGFADFSFLNSAPGANVIQRSPLSAFPVPQDLPGVIGYFQIDPDGRFSTPLLPNDDTDAADVGLPAGEVSQRRAIAEEIHRVLADNALVSARPASVARSQQQAQAVEEIVVTAGRTVAEREEASTVLADSSVPASASPVFPAEADADAAPLSYEQRQFDRLNQPAPADEPGAARKEVTTRLRSTDVGLPSNYGAVDDLRVDDELERKYENMKRNDAVSEDLAKSSATGNGARARRIEQTVVPASPAVSEPARGLPAAITTFESEIDPFQFSLLNSGHLVLYRNVWRSGARYIQGLLVDQESFSRAVVESTFRATTLSGMSDLLVGYQDDIIDVVRGSRHESLVSVPEGDLDGSLLYRSRLSAPFDSLELAYSINRMPPGPGAAVLGWTTVILGIVFVGGFIALYRLGLGQIRLARQQQDFVSAVSHELKTPLTSIRMYGEMLKEGWADEEKRKQYYEYIHDESERLTRLIANVLQLAKLTRNEPQVDLRPVTVGTLMDQVMSKIANQAKRAGFRLDFDFDDARDATVSVDNDCFAQIIINLVDNAIKFSKDATDKRIDIGCSVSSRGETVFTVRDYGPGIPRDQLNKIFRMFYRSESELTRETVGTGIGLAIVHQLSIAMGAAIDVVNRDPGAEFRLSFPS